MALAFLALLFFLVGSLTAHLILRVHGNYLLTIFQFLLSFFAVYGFGLYHAREAIAEFHGADVLPFCWFVVLVGLAGIGIGYRVFPVPRVRRWPYLRAPVRINRLGLVGILLLVTGIAGELYFILHSGGTEAYYSTARGGGSFETTTGYIYGARWLWIPGIAFLGAAGTAQRLWRIWGVAGLTLLGGYNLLLGSRTGTFLTVLTTLYLRALWSRSVPRIRTVLAALAVAAVLMGFVVLTRGDFRLGSDFSTIRALLERSPSEILEETILNNIRPSGTGYTQGTEIILFAGFVRVFPQSVHYDYFKYYTSFIYTWIPRILWPSRPDPAQEKVIELVDVLGTSHRSGPTPTMLGMYYMHLGIVSVFLLSALTGLYLAFIDANGRLAFTHPSAAVVFVSMAGSILSMPMGLGLFASAPILLPFTVVPVIAGLWWAQGPRRKTRQCRVASGQSSPRAATVI